MSDLKKITDSNFVDDVLKNEKPVLVDFWAPWCMPCLAMAPELEKAAEEFGDDVIVGKMNVDENQAVAGQLGIRSIPTMALFHNGDVIWSSAGTRPAAQLVSEIRDAMAVSSS